jgi:hypothetical protein
MYHAQTLTIERAVKTIYVVEDQYMRVGNLPDMPLLGTFLSLKQFRRVEPIAPSDTKPSS